MSNGLILQLVLAVMGMKGTGGQKKCEALKTDVEVLGPFILGILQQDGDGVSLLSWSWA